MTYETTIAVINGILYLFSGFFLVLGGVSFYKKDYLGGLQSLCWAGISFCFAHM